MAQVRVPVTSLVDVEAHSRKHWPKLSTQPAHSRRKFPSVLITVVASCVLGAVLFYSHVPSRDGAPGSIARAELASFYHSMNTHDEICPGGRSRSGFIGLKDDKESEERKSFFWLFEAQHDPEHAPVILTIGGGPGSSGLANPLLGQSHCIAAKNGVTRPNPNAWSEKYNLLALDHPIGAGFSYGRRVGTSREAAYDVYDFLVKFFVLNPRLAENDLVLAGGSYGGMYIPHIASVIHEQNQLVARGKRGYIPGAKVIKFKAMMVSNPISDYLARYNWVLQQRCYYTDLFNASICHDAYERLPFCLESIQRAYMHDATSNIPAVDDKIDAVNTCEAAVPEFVDGRSMEDVTLRCDGSLLGCVPQIGWITTFFNNETTKRVLGVPQDHTWSFENEDIQRDFAATGDRVQQSNLLYAPLLDAGYRLLHYVGKLDGNSGWPGVLFTIKLIPSRYQDAFAATPDVRWADQNATVRVIGDGAGEMTYILMDYAGHWVTKDQPALVKKIVGHWVDNVPFQ